MNSTEWDRGLETGHPAIDEQHRELFLARARALESARDRDGQATRAAAQEILDLTRRHFAFEELPHGQALRWLPVTRKVSACASRDKVDHHLESPTLQTATVSAKPGGTRPFQLDARARRNARRLGVGLLVLPDYPERIPDSECGRVQL
jgi:hypothetical protein